MKFIGAHVSAAGGVENAPQRANDLGAQGFAIFLKNQRQWKSAPLSEKSITLFKENLEKYGYTRDAVLPHDGYLINLGNPDPEKRKQSQEAFLEEAQRVEQLGLKYLNFHPGSHLKKVDPQDCLDLIAEGIRATAEATKSVVFVLETTAGQGTNLGHTFEQVAYLLDKVGAPERTGVCIDTCHIFAAGYDIRTKEAYEKTMSHFDETVGLSKLCAMHLNDAKNPLGSRVDRHETIGEGMIGLEAFRLFMEDPRIDNIPTTLETPNSEKWATSIKTLREYADQL